MKYLIVVLLLKLLLKVIDFLDRIFDERKLKLFRENLDIRCELWSESSCNPSDMSYTFRPFEVTKVRYKNQAKSSTRPLYPKPRSGHRIVCSDSAIYSFGGFNPNQAVNQDDMDDNEAFCLFQELWKYNLITKEWKLLLNSENDLPLELASNAMLLQGDSVMVFGGTGFPFGVNCSNKLYVYQPSKNPKQMEEIEAKGDPPPPQYGQAIVCHENYLYTVGGTDGFDYTCDVFRLNLITRVWECVYMCKQDIREDPAGRYRHEIAYDKKCIYLFGGGTSDSAFELVSIPTFDLRENVWKYTKTKPDTSLPLPAYPKPRKCHSCVQVKTDNDLEVIIAGGYDGRAYFKDIWKLSLKTLEWRLLRKTSLNFPLFFHDAAANSDGCMFIFGGIKYNNNNNVRTDIVYKMWTTIPKLSAICWDALLHYNPNITSLTKEQMLETGIPIKFAKRIHES